MDLCFNIYICIYISECLCLLAVLEAPQLGRPKKQANYFKNTLVSSLIPCHDHVAHKLTDEHMGHVAVAASFASQ
jgi:hypothetical protein